MPAVDQQRADQLLALARARFDTTLRPIEEQVLIHSCRYEDPPDWASSSMSGIEAAAANGGRSRPERTPTGRPLPGWQGPELRPALLRWALTDLEATALLEPRGLRVWNARLTEPLDLTGCHITARLELRYCLVEAPILLASAELPALSLRNSTLQLDLNAPSLKLAVSSLQARSTCSARSLAECSVVET